VQVDSIKTRVESAYGVCNQRLKLKYDKLLSTFAFKFNLRHYNTNIAPTFIEQPPQDYNEPNGCQDLPTNVQTAKDSCGVTLSTSAVVMEESEPRCTVGRCRLPVSKPELKARLASALETKM
jgi:hypothetical protein